MYICILSKTNKTDVLSLKNFQQPLEITIEHVQYTKG